jgi:hypothetical protein
MQSVPAGVRSASTTAPLLLTIRASKTSPGAVAPTSTLPTDSSVQPSGCASQARPAGQRKTSTVSPGSVLLRTFSTASPLAPVFD